ncbi:MAG: hypothetical protein JWQ09_1848 [Segetibacter sp.]|nr:hypothetical protein [Segetibacter sp.]
MHHFQLKRLNSHQRHRSHHNQSHHLHLPDLPVPGDILYKFPSGFWFPAVYHLHLTFLKHILFQNLPNVFGKRR